MTLHELKIKKIYWDEILEGNKTFELRKNDRDYKVGDLINFSIVDITSVPIKTKAVFIITYILKDVPEYGLDKDYCILGIKQLGVK